MTRTVNNRFGILTVVPPTGWDLTPENGPIRLSHYLMSVDTVAVIHLCHIVSSTWASQFPQEADAYFNVEGLAPLIAQTQLGYNFDVVEANNAIPEEPVDHLEERVEAVNANEPIVLAAEEDNNDEANQVEAVVQAIVQPNELIGLIVEAGDVNVIEVRNPAFAYHEEASEQSSVSTEHGKKRRANDKLSARKKARKSGKK